MAGFSEDTRVKIPALTHLTRIGYTYRSLHSLHLDPETNIDIETFSKKLHDFNPEISDNEIELFIGRIRVMLNNEDLGREFYEKILSNKTYNVIDYDDRMGSLIYKTRTPNVQNRLWHKKEYQKL